MAGIAALALLLVAGGYAAGRFTAPTRVTETVKEDTTARARVRELTEQLEAYKQHTTTETVITYAPTGKPATKTTRTDTHVDRVVDTRTDLHATAETATKRESVTVTENDRSSVRVGLGVEVTPKTLTAPDVRLSGGLRLGPTPLWLDLSVSASPAAPRLDTLRFGVGLALEF
jgi:hypothetical protein